MIVKRARINEASDKVLTYEEYNNLLIKYRKSYSGEDYKLSIDFKFDKNNRVTRNLVINTDNFASELGKHFSRNAWYSEIDLLEVSKNIEKLIAYYKKFPYVGYIIETPFGEFLD